MAIEISNVVLLVHALNRRARRPLLRRAAPQAPHTLTLIGFFEGRARDARQGSRPVDELGEIRLLEFDDVGS
jgi:hypothetical protein